MAVRSIEEECPNLREKKSFISFDEIMKKIDHKKVLKHSSFIESDEKSNI